jgi:hypothetical protein
MSDTDVDRTIANALASMAPPAPESGDAWRLIERRVRVRRRAARLAVVVAATGALIAAGLGVVVFGHTGAGTTVRTGAPPPTARSMTTPLTSAPPTPSTTPRAGPPPAATTPNSSARVDPAAALDALVKRHGASHASSGVIRTSNGELAAVSYNVAPPNGGTTPHVTILTFDGSTWVKVTDVALDLGGMVLPLASNATPITVVHLTGSATPDFAVIVNYNDGPAAAIISRARGSWRPLLFSGGPHGGDEIINPTFTATAVAERANTCTPSCAAGNYVTTVYQYSQQTGTMVAGG